MALNEIKSYEELNSLIEDGIIRQEFWVDNPNVNKLIGVKEIRTEDHGSVYFKKLVDIGELEYINCGLSFFTNLTSLNKLKYIGGTFRYAAPFKTLGLLEEIGEDSP